MDFFQDSLEFEMENHGHHMITFHSPFAVSNLCRNIKTNQEPLPYTGKTEVLSTTKRIQNLRIEGDTYALKKNYKAAIQAYSKAIKLVGPFIHTSFKASLYCHRAICYMKLNYFALAIPDAEKSMSFEPSWATPFYCHGYSCIKCNRHTVGHASIRKVIKEKTSIRLQMPNGCWIGGYRSIATQKKTMDQMTTISKLNEYDCDIPLPKGWVVQECRLTGQVFYYNAETKAKQWHPPRTQPMQFVKPNFM